jgi:hypothetical protein
MEKVKSSKNLLTKPEIKSRTGRHGSRGDNNIKISLQWKYEGANWLHLALDGKMWRTLVNTVLKGQLPLTFTETMYNEQNICTFSNKACRHTYGNT